VVLVVEGISVPAYTKVWDTARALRDQGADVSVICPRSMGFTKARETLEGIDIYRHPLLEATTPLGFVPEYLHALGSELGLLARIARKRRIHAIHAVSPPDLVFLPALPFILAGSRFVFDHHDLNPEMFVAKFGRRGPLVGLLRLFEALSFQLASHSIAPNETSRDIAVGRGRMDPARVTVVRSGPDPRRLKIGPGNPAHRQGKAHLVGYVGLVEKQDCLDTFVEIVRRVLDRRSDVHFALVGDGTELAGVRRLAARLGVDDAITFHGWVSDGDLLSEILCTCDVCVSPDRPNEYTDRCTTIKTMEYMLLGKPIVQFDLREARISAGDSALYARNGDVHDFADRIDRLLDDEPLRREMGDRGRRRVLDGLAWEFQREALIELYADVLGVP